MISSNGMDESKEGVDEYIWNKCKKKKKSTGMSAAIVIIF